MMKQFLTFLTVAAIATLAACSSPSGGNVPSPVKGTGASTAPTPAGGATLVGVGDSLTAGEQSDALLGTVTTSSISGYPGGAVFPGQVSGWWAIMYDCYSSTGSTCNHTPYTITAPLPLPSNASSAVLPLINAPGLGTQLVLTTTGSLGATQSGCSTFNVSAWGASTWTGTRASSNIGTADLGVPGITMHEAVYMNGPYSGPPTQTSSGCGYATIPNDPTSGGLQSLVESENQLFYPILGAYQAAYGSSLTQLNVAAGMKPKLVTVWLGANDLLKFIFSAGTAPASDTPTQMATDLTKIVKTLTATGAKVLVADLPTLLPTSGTGPPQFFPQAKVGEDLEALGVPSAAAGAIVSYIGTQYGVTSGGYLTESGFLAIVETCETPATEADCLTPQLDPTTAGSGLGAYYLTPAFAAEVQALNAGYNQAIDGVAEQFAAAAPGSVALVPINTFFQTAATSGVSVAGFPAPLTMQFGGGLVTWDGLHPSNLGYAVIANEFISTADTAATSGGLGMTIPELSALQLAQIASNDPYDPYVIKSGDPTSPFPLP